MPAPLRNPISTIATAITVLVIAFGTLSCGSEPGPTQPSGPDGPTEPVGWQWMNPLPHGKPLTNVQVLGSGEFSALLYPSQIQQTSDSGDTWTYKSLASEEWVVEWLVTANDSMVTLDYSGHVSTSANGGESWESRSATNEALSRVYGGWFWSTTDLYAVGSSGLIARTTDGGLSWDLQESGTNSTINVIAFRDERVGVAGGEQVLLHTEDGGAHWESERFSGEFRALAFFEPAIALAVGVSGAGIMRSVDNGVSWKSVDLATPDRLLLSDICVVDGSIGVAVGGRPGVRAAILRTVDAGATWEFIPFDFPGYLWSVRFLNANYGVAVGQGGVCVETTDGGLTWQRLTQGAAENLYDIHFTSEGYGAAVGKRGTVLWSEDAGRTWVERPVGADVSLRCVWTLNASTAVAAGYAHNQVYRTADRGQTWTPWTLDVDDYCEDIRFLDDANGFITSGAFDLLRTSDGGSTWTVLDIGARGLSTIEFSREGVGMAISYDARLFRSLDDGDSWGVVDAPQGFHQPGGGKWLLASLGDGTWLTVSGDGLWRLEDDGENWDFRGRLGWETPLAMAFADSLNGLITTKYNYILRTTDGGESWFSQENPGAESYGIQFLTESDVVAAGWSGSIIRTSDGGGPLGEYVGPIR